MRLNMYVVKIQTNGPYCKGGSKLIKFTESEVRYNCFTDVELTKNIIFNV